MPDRYLHKDQDIDDVIGIKDISPTSILPTTSSPTAEQKIALRKAQNVNRGHPRKGEYREPLKQLNISCRTSVYSELDSLSLRIGKTKRELLEDGITYLLRKYRK